MDKLLGEVSYVSNKGFCFVVGLDSASFLHFKEIEKQLVPRVGDLIAYSIRPSQTKPGRNEAYDARITKRADDAPLDSKAHTEPITAKGGSDAR